MGVLGNGSIFVEALAIVLAASHVATVALIVLWLGLRKPRSRREFWARFKREFLSFSPASR